MDCTGIQRLSRNIVTIVFYQIWKHFLLILQQKVRPSCGRLVGFEAGDYHGVEAVTQGKRCAVAVWYTLDPIDQETNHADANMVLNMLDNQAATR